VKLARKSSKRPSSLEQLVREISGEPKNKFGAVKEVVNGIEFDSKTEARRYRELLKLVRAGLIEDLEVQPVYILVKSVKYKNAKKSKPAMKYTADFRYYDTKKGELVVEDVKSKATAKQTDYIMRRHMMLAFHDIEILETY
jgi:hypothetical protein